MIINKFKTIWQEGYNAGINGMLKVDSPYGITDSPFDKYWDTGWKVGQLERASNNQFMKELKIWVKLGLDHAPTQFNTLVDVIDFFINIKLNPLLMKRVLTGFVTPQINGQIWIYRSGHPNGNFETGLDPKEYYKILVSLCNDEG